MSELDPVIHAQARLRTMTVLNTLGVGDTIAFPRLQELLQMTSGNLATHLRKLEGSGYVSVEKVLEGRSPVTYIGLSRRAAVRLPPTSGSCASSWSPPADAFGGTFNP
ncbi:transcriptional regulator [Arthrobacter sp. JCM 19049]|uniref:transcriptional regulator n=1 Tax=Arthrobacter sp. JCM 19049 TaxID=1460643 RepID=UPI000AFF9D8D|nr:transcriptional regulator [Arthrobacter sp. JCM 19049]